MIHQYKLGGYNIVLDVCSGAVHAVDEVAYDIIALFEEKSREDILIAMEEKYAERADISREDIAEAMGVRATIVPTDVPMESDVKQAAMKIPAGRNCSGTTRSVSATVASTAPAP